MPKATTAQNAAQQAERRRKHNRVRLSTVRSYLSRAQKLIADKEPAAEEAVRQAISALDRAAQKKVIHPHNAARRKSRLVREFNAAFKESTEAAASPPPPARRAVHRGS